MAYNIEKGGRHFNPRPPWGGRLQRLQVVVLPRRISIHALRGEGDCDILQCGDQYRDFNPRPPWGGRQLFSPDSAKTYSFQSTPSVGRATRLTLRYVLLMIYFNPRPPWGGRHILYRYTFGVRNISIHALRGEGDSTKCKGATSSLTFQSTPSVGRATTMT